MSGYLKHASILIVTVALLALFLRQADLAAVARELSQAHPGGILLALLASVATFVFRTFRWQYLLLPAGDVPFGPALRATVIGFGANAMLPGRVGEVIRPYLLARKVQLDPTATFATIVLERALDIITLLLLFACTVAFLDPGFAVNDGQTLRAVQFGGLLAAGASLVGLIIAFLFAGHAERVSVVTERLTRRLPARVGTLAVKVVGAFGEGFAVLRTPVALALAFGWSIAVWLSIALTTWAMATAFALPLTFVGTFTVLMFMAVGVSVPTPGGVGAFHESVRLALVSLYAADNDRAVAYAVALHALSFIPVSLATLVLIAREGLSLRGIGDISRTVAPGAPLVEGRDAG
ncbi:MAG TPA: lysylphosphatidylglycerol synthase transmembrane domain-containing protein [Luteitalea sp.]|nr:lysylphosphatidylglycerol synthase transmembrane domain-containing protein [Luteitalea sp.]